MMEPIRITAPLDAETARSLRAGDRVLLCPSCTSVPQAESMVSARAAAVKSAQSFFIVVSPCPLSVTR